ncbi:hypothetical protein ACI65C_004329 [Semiaphis heraclei]
MKTDNKYTSGDIEYAQSEDIGIMRWKDRGSKPVTLISNMHNSSDTSTVLRKNGVDHMPKFIDKYRRCKMCSTKAKEKRSNMICSTCEITLCKQCFKPYHKPT